MSRESGSSSVLRGELERAGYEVISVFGLERLFATLGDLGADLLILDTGIDERAPFEICGEIRAMEAGRLLPLVLVSMGPVNEAMLAQGLIAGADDFCLPKERPAEFMARVRVQLRNKRIRDRLRRVRNERDHYKRVSKVDPLTGVLNRGSFDALLTEAMMSGGKFAILFIDIDHFKTVNDRFGHDVGDDVLRRVAKRIEKGTRGGDHCGRYGGEEFVVLVAGADEAIAPAVAERHRKNLETMEIPALKESLTASVGVAVYDPSKPDLLREALYRRADAALYRAKRAGRNRVEVAPSTDEFQTMADLPPPTRKFDVLSEASILKAPLPEEPPPARSSRPSMDPRSSRPSIEVDPEAQRIALAAHAPPLIAADQPAETKRTEGAPAARPVPVPHSPEAITAPPPAAPPEPAPPSIPAVSAPKRGATPKPVPVVKKVAYRPEQVESALLKAMSSRRAGLPLLPDATQQAMRLARDHESDMPRIAALVDRDPTLAARFLALANSPLYSSGSRIVSTHAALVRLGLATARDLLLQVVYERSQGGLKRYHREVEACFQRSVIAALSTVEVARAKNLIFEDGYLCGLLHDIGEARIYRVLAEIEGDHPQGLVADLIERHHVRAGAEIARAWGLPQEVIDVCEEHHEPPRGVSERVRAVMMADCIANAVTSRRGPQSAAAMSLTPEETDRLDLLGLEPRVATVIMQGVFVAARMLRT